MTEQHVQRKYRRLHTGKDLIYFHVKLKESDLAIGVDAAHYSDSLTVLCRRTLAGIRSELESYILLDPSFQHSLLPVTPLPGATPLVKSMIQAAKAAGVGPMAAVAGAVAQAIGEAISPYARQVIIENGGDIYMRGTMERIVAVYAGSSRFSHQVGIRVSAQEQPLGICTSSGTVGPSLSFGRADAVVVKGYPAGLADAVATRAGNLIQNEADLMKAVELVKDIQGITGILAIKNDTMAAWGAMELVSIQRRNGDESSS